SDRVAALMDTLARAVHHAHERGVIHRDLRPNNILLTEDGHPKLTDFGLAKRLDEVSVTKTGELMGTPSYMSPEQAYGQSKQVGPHTDVWMLGAVLYECLTGRPPFKEATLPQTILAVLHTEPVRPRTIQPSVPRDLETICLKCLRKEPHKRYASAAALAEDIQRFLRDEPIRARPVGPAEKLWRWVRRHPLAAGLLAAGLLAPAVALITLSLLSGRL